MTNGQARCPGCSRVIAIRAKSLCNSCYYRWLRLGRPDELPLARGKDWNRQPGSAPGKWLTVTRRSEAMLARLEGYQELVDQGLTQVEIARRMGVSTETVRHYKQITLQDQASPQDQALGQEGEQA
jgi:Sigma-70, region 4